MEALDRKSLSRAPAALAAAGLALALAAALGPARAFADTVRLKNGQVLTGDVEDRGPHILVRKPLGDVRIERHEILSIEIEGGGAVPRGERDLDVVVLLSGDEISGRVRLEGEGRRVIVARAIAGHESALELDYRQVREIRWASQAAGGGGAAAERPGIAQAVEKLLAELRAPDAAARARARDQLIDLGVFTLPYLEARPKEADPAVAELLRQVVAVAHVRACLTPALVERVPDLARRLVVAEPRERIDALKEALLAAPKDCPALLHHLARADAAPEVRAFVLAQLALANRTSELLDLLQSEDGRLRLAAAIALGDNGVYVGAPLLIEALKLDDPAVRKVAMARLEAWTGQFLGYFPDDPPEKRSAAVARWEAWWAEEGKKLAAESVRATIQKDSVSEDEKQLGIADWLRAMQAWDAIAEADPPLAGEARKAELEKVRFLLRKAIGSYPHFVNARLALGVLAYTELGEPAAARRELEVLLSRYAEDGGALTRALAHYHLGRITELEGKWIEADRHYRGALAIAPNDADALLALGSLCYERALRDESLAPEARRGSLEEAISVFGEAIRTVDAREAEVRESAAAAEAVSDGSPFRAQAFRRTLESGRRDLTRLAAELRFRRGRSFAALQRKAEAYRDFLGASQLDPGNPLYRDAASAYRPTPEEAADTKPRFHPRDVK